MSVQILDQYTTIDYSYLSYVMFNIWFCLFSGNNIMSSSCHLYHYHFTFHISCCLQLSCHFTTSSR